MTRVSLRSFAAIFGIMTIQAIAQPPRARDLGVPL